MKRSRRRFVSSSIPVFLATCTGCLSRSRRENPRLVYVALENWSAEKRSVDLEINAGGKTHVELQTTLESIDESDGQPDPADAPYQLYVSGEWPERGEYEAVARMAGVDRPFRSTSRGFEPGGYFGLRGVIHPGRDVIGWFIERIDPDELDEYRVWLDKYGVTR